MSKLSTLLVMGVVASATTAHATSPCDLKTNATLKYRYEIQSMDTVTSRSYDIGEGARKCVVNFAAMVNGKWYPTQGVYVYGPDITEKNACGRAELKAKENILKQVSPVIVNSEKNMNCSLTSKPKPVIIKTKVRGVSSCREKRTYKTVYVKGMPLTAWRKSCD